MGDQERDELNKLLGFKTIDMATMLKSVGDFSASEDEEVECWLERMVHTFSKSLNSAEKNYSTTDKELLAIVKALEYFRKYILGSKFILKTDHRALTYLWKTENLQGILMRWSLKLQAFDFDVEYIKGCNNYADGLSRFTKDATIKEEESINKIDIMNVNNKKILGKYHLVSGHGSESTLKFLLKNEPDWKGSYKEIEDFVKTCPVCIKRGRIKSNTCNKVIESNNSNEMLFVDLIGRIENEEKESKFILVTIDHFTKWVNTRVLQNKDKNTVLNALKDIFKTNECLPKRIICDNGKEFTNKLFNSEIAKLGIEIEHCSPYHHQTMGVVERTNQTLWEKIKALSQFGKKSWEKIVKRATFAVNISFNRAINTSPYIAKYGREPFILGKNTEGENKMGKDNLKLIYKNIRRHKESYKKAIIKGFKNIKRDIEIGSAVLIYNQPPRNPLESDWLPGYKVTRHIGKDAYELSKGEKNFRLNKIHVKRDTSLIGEVS